MNRQELKEEIEALQQDLKFKAGIITNCMSCDHLIKGKCMVHNADVPEEFKRSEECPDWSYDGVPF